MTLTVLLFCIYIFLSFDTSICSTLPFPPLKTSNLVLVSVSIDFPANSTWNVPFHCISYDYSSADWDGLHDYFRDISWEDIFKLSVSAAGSEFCQWAQVDIDVCIPHCKYQVRPHSYLHAFQLLVLLP